jgi:hypothetical protein
LKLRPHRRPSSVAAVSKLIDVHLKLPRRQPKSDGQQRNDKASRQSFGGPSRQTSFSTPSTKLERMPGPQRLRSLSYYPLHIALSRSRGPNNMACQAKGCLGCVIHRPWLYHCSFQANQSTAYITPAARTLLPCCSQFWIHWAERRLPLRNCRHTCTPSSSALLL